MELEKPFEMKVIDDFLKIPIIHCPNDDYYDVNIPDAFVNVNFFILIELESKIV